MTGIVTNWSQRREMGEGTKRVEAETLYHKEIAGAPGRIRTRDPRFRKPLLYPTELQARFVVSLNNKIKTLKSKVRV